MKPVKKRFSPWVLCIDKTKYFSVFPSLYRENQFSEEEPETHTPHSSNLLTQTKSHHSRSQIPRILLRFQCRSQSTRCYREIWGLKNPQTPHKCPPKPPHCQGHHQPAFTARFPGLLEYISEMEKPSHIIEARDRGNFRATTRSCWYFTSTAEQPRKQKRKRAQVMSKWCSTSDPDLWNQTFLCISTCAGAYWVMKVTQTGRKVMSKCPTIF